MGHGGQKEDPDEARCDQQIDDASFPSGFEAYPCRQQIGCDAGYIPWHGRKHDASREFGCEDTLQVYTQQDKAQREDRKNLEQTCQQHQKDHSAFGIGEVQGQFESFLLHLGDKLYASHQHTRTEGKIGQNLDEYGVSRQQNFPKVTHLLEVDYAL